jgi:hypothetical protein
MINTRDKTRNHLHNPQRHESPKYTAQVLTRTNLHCNNNRQDHGEQRAHLYKYHQWE